MHYPEHLQKLIAVFKKLPGVGTKSAERFAFHLLDWSEEKLLEISQVIESTPDRLKKCLECGCLMGKERCSFCQNPHRHQQVLCIVASPKDVFLIEETGEYRGLYHVLGGLFSPLHGQSLGPDVVETLKRRIHALEVKEMIIALDSTLEGDATALYLKKELEDVDVQISRPALGLPMGSSLDFIDGGTLAHALASRHTY